MTEDPKISGRYRELPREEPPRSLDDAILAASRRAVDSRPAPLVVPTGRRRWYFPLAAAAVIVLAVAVTVHVEREQPGEEMVVAVEPAKEVLRTEPPVEKAQPKPERPYQYTPDPKPAPAPAERAAGSRDLQEQRSSAAAEAPRAASPAVPAPAPATPSEQQPRALGRAQEPASADRAEKTDALAKRADEARSQLGRAEAARSRVQATAGPAADTRLNRATPEQWLQGIDDLKRQGKHEEAERELAEFRKRYPNHRIPEAISEKFERR